MGKSAAVLTTLWSAAVSAVMFLVMHYFVAPRLPVNAVEVPPVHGLSPEQARGLLEPRGLLLVIDGERPDNTVGPGAVSEQRPLGGSRLRRGDEVHATLGKVVVNPIVPNVAGMTQDAARDALERAKLRLGKATEGPSDTIARGLVASTSPAIGAEARPDATVDVVLSSGPNTQLVPSVVGKRLGTAKDLLQKAGFAVGGTRFGSNDDYEQGIVIRQNPPAGAQATPGVKIDLVIND
jgi:serine/threonine-protein kinase